MCASIGGWCGWYIGNILFGGLIGMLAVRWKNTSSASGTLTIVSTDSLTPEDMKRARLLATSN